MSILSQRAEQFVSSHMDELLSLTGELCAIPAPSHREEARAAFCRDWFEKHCGSAYIDNNNKIRLVFWNMSRYYTVDKVYFRIDCYDTQGNPIVCTKDGGTSFSGNYPLSLEPGARTEHGRFHFGDYQETGLYGYVVVTITGYAFDNGQKWWIPDGQMAPYRSTYSNHWGEPTPTPAPAGN